MPERRANLFQRTQNTVKGRNSHERKDLIKNVALHREFYVSRSATLPTVVTFEINHGSHDPD